MSRLTELLERIRPAGAPGAASEGGPATDSSADTELEEVSERLARFDADADELLRRARELADDEHARTDERIAQLRAGLAERVAVARADVNRSHEEQHEAEAARILADAAAEADRRRRAADAGLDGIVASGLERIWQLLDDVATAGDGAPR